MSNAAPTAARPAADRTTASTGGVTLLVLLGTLTAIGPLSLDMYLPAFPAMTRDLGADQAGIQLSLTTCLIGLALGQLVTGPLSDRWGRRRPVLVGVVAYTVLALACAAAPNAPLLAAARFAQGVAGGMGVVVARAVVRDLYSGRDAAKYFSRLTLVFGVAPVAAPGVGSLVLRFGSWRAVFVALAVIGAVLAVAVALRLPETLPAERRSTGGLGATVRTMRSLLADRVYLGYALTQGFAFAGLFAYISGSSFVFQDVFGVSAAVFSVIFGVNALALVAVGQANARLLDRFTPRRLLVTTLVVGLVTAVGVLSGALAGSLAVTAVALFAFVGSLGMVMPNSTALALDAHARHAGTAAALMGGIQSVVGALAAPLVGLGGEGSALPMAVVLAGAAFLSLTAVLTMTRPRA
ncbi:MULTISPECIES: multidrug effflux MFS transporter [Micromonospora]|uniref:Multidrug effflux MFS transporter n=1 Tax=Micromonospora aurantiaca (nom. illeg.) TaxID=47850 RepID=A0ABQ6U6I7_9ACTN|nr:MULTISPECIES: multidrug effflux MFS transporter [Micromonospora]KAB1098676.1 multidrug effflux MFS transporter [Micromonospora aurantiaca]MBC9006215.1 multidrug effflux MFS transporter [Micromonospora aurantiaca]MDG4753040.1 multidrug effflux MFS transporter [Micromonospora sp. WMMD718]OHX06762.1 Bcr/CflA family drug resistance efflux transporter [Micromonospora sp. WMMB235]RNH98965.1 Bcr/CflA family efflux MFS transporter [Micromonospora aurantiaca]